MAVSSPIVFHPFYALDRDWAITCRRQRRRGVMARWAIEEPALAGMRQLADLIPPADVDRAPIAAAVARLHIAGDDLASRAFLQLLIPGMFRLTARWRTTRPGGVNEAGWDIISRAAVYVGQLRERGIHCSPTAYVLLSVHRDLVLESRDDRSQILGREPSAIGELAADRALIPSAEETVCARLAVQQELRSAVAAGVLPPDVVEVIWLVLSGHPMSDVAARAGLRSSTSYRWRARVYAHLYTKLFGPEPSEAR